MRPRDAFRASSNYDRCRSSGLVSPRCTAPPLARPPGSRRAAKALDDAYSDAEAYAAIINEDLEDQIALLLHRNRDAASVHCSTSSPHIP